MNFLAEHINLFKPTTGRAKNDINNKLRESFFLVCGSSSSNQTIFEDPIYGLDCVNLKEKFETKLKEFGEYNKYTIKQMAGRKYNYDFLLELENDQTDFKKEIKLEFKFNAKTISNIPQFIQKNTTWNIFGEKYHDHFYDGPYLTEIIALNDEPMPIPTKEEYMKHIMKTNYECHPFFKYLKETENIKKLEKHNIVKKSITQYLTQYAQTIDINIFKNTIMETQNNKEYLLYDPKTASFYLEKMDMNMESLVFDRIHRKNTIVLKTDKNEYHLLLRWKNHQGILNSAWQVSITPCKINTPKERKKSISEPFINNKK
jgi:hypothetical protein